MPTAFQTRPGVQRPGTSALLSLLLVFLAGVAVGALAMSLGIHNPLHRTNTAWIENGQTHTMQRWKKQLNLTDEQSKKIEVVLDDFWKYYDNVLADGNTRILEILNADQRLKFEKMLKERH